MIDRNQADVEVSDFALLIVAGYLLGIVLRHLFITLEGMLFISTNRGDTVHLLMGFIGLSSLPTISSNTGASSEPEEYRSAYPLEERAGAVWFRRWGSWVSIVSRVGTE